MANEIRLRRNNIAGTITDNPLAIGATTINSAGFVDLPVVDATNHMILILDPLEVGGTAEIVRVTAHTAAATSVTVVRGQEGSVARSHVFNTTWFHGPVASDTILSDVTSSTRPSVPYEGEFIYETDTNKLVGFGGVDWAPRDAGGQIGYAQIVASSAALGAGPTDIPGLTVAVTVGTGRRIKISAQGELTYSDGTTGHFIDVHQDGVALGRVWMSPRIATTDALVLFGSIITSPTGGAHTYKLVAQRYVGAGNLVVFAAATVPAYILVEDIGAA